MENPNTPKSDLCERLAVHASDSARRQAESAQVPIKMETCAVNNPDTQPSTPKRDWLALLVAPLLSALATIGAALIGKLL